MPAKSPAQRIVHVDIDTVACLGDSVFIGIGYQWGHEVVVENVQTTLSHPGRVFLPDGIPCGTLGCSYRSPVTFSGFSSDAAISSVNDIQYVRLNIEHSYIADIYINLTCPNGQKANIMKFGGSNTAQCHTAIPSDAVGWLSGGGGNMSGGNFFGIPVDQEDYGDKCDSTLSGNRPGVGWNYCWSDNTASGYNYAHTHASDDGIIYRSGHQHNGRVDSSNVAARTNFYHPDQSFSNLIGCPLNGEWYIEVVDGFSVDNGYIFDWELSLDPSLVPTSGEVVGLDVLGSEVTRTGDSTFLVSAPAGTEGDTTIDYRVLIYGSHGDTLDTVVSVHYIAHSYQLIQDTLCQGDTLRIDTLVITETLHRIDTLASSHDCYTIREIDVTVLPRYERYDTVSFCYGALTIYNDSVFAGMGDYTLHFETAEGCDSNTFLHIEVLDSGFRAAPLISDDGEIWRRDTMLAGCVPMTVWLKDTTVHVATQYWSVDDSTWFSGDSLTYDFDSAGIYTITYIAISEHGCTDTVVLKRAVWVFDNPVAEFSWAPEHPVMSHPTVEFFNDSRPDGLSFLWLIQTLAGEDSLHHPHPIYTWDADGENIYGDFTVLLTAFQTYTGPYDLPVKCQDTTSATITIINDWLQFPNLVTPNGDGTNDIWKVVNLLECGEYSMNELWIFNRWGTLVYHFQNIRREEDFWNPDETNSPDGTYYFRFSAKSLHGLVRTNGAIEVVR